MAEAHPSTRNIKTQRLTLREVRKWDLPAVHELFKDRDVMRYWGTPNKSMYQTAIYLDRMIQSSSNGMLAFVIVLHPSSALAASSSTSATSSTKPRPRPQLPIPTAVDEGIVIGHAGLWFVEKSELLFMLGRPYWGQGYMAEVLAALVPIFWEYGLKTVYADVASANVLGLNVLRKSGFKQIREDTIESHHGIKINLHMELMNPKYGEGREIKRKGEGKGKGKEREK